MEEKKNKSQVFTPEWMVKLMLNRIGYKTTENIVDKHIIDNSCGDGAFLCEIVERYIAHCQLSNVLKKDIKKGLETYIHGIEIDKQIYKKCLHNLDETVRKYNLTNIRWNIKNEDAFDDTSFLYSMHYVVGNPPYIKVHDLTEEKRDKYKKYCGLDKGAFDIYIAFFELGIRMLNEYGRLIYITPGAWIDNIAAKSFREHIVKHEMLVSVINNRHNKIFGNANVFTMITELSKKPYKGNVTVSELSKKEILCRITETCSAPINDYVIDDKKYELCFEQKEIQNYINYKLNEEKYNSGDRQK